MQIQRERGVGRRSTSFPIAAACERIRARGVRWPHGSFGAVCGHAQVRPERPRHARADARKAVELTGGGALALVPGRFLPQSWLAGRSAANPLVVAAVSSGGDAAPAQLAALRGAR